MSAPVRIALVSYLNTVPFLDGIRAAFSVEEVELLLLPPAKCAEALREGTCDLALLPTGSIPDFEGLTILPDYCLGADGAVESVYIFAQQPIHTLSAILIDKESRTSNELARLLMDFHWQHKAIFKEEAGDYLRHIRGEVGGVAIGDKAIRNRALFPYQYDLPLAWQALTGMPFVFAVWAYRQEGEKKVISRDFLHRFYLALEKGVHNKDRSALLWSERFQVSPVFAADYLNSRMKYHFSPEMHRAFLFFLRHIGLGA